MKKSLPVILAVALCLALFAGCGSTEELPETELTDFSSVSGYTVSYPVDYTPSAYSAETDFVVMDETTGTSVNITTKDKIDNISDFTEEVFVEQMQSEGMDVSVLSFEQQKINDIPVLVIKYTYKETEITSIIYDASEHTYFATYTELPGTSGKVRSEMTAIIYSLNIQ